MFVFALLACSSSTEAPGDPEAAAGAADARTGDAGALVVYSGRSESLVGPLFEQLEKDLGFEIQVQYGKTDELVTRLVTEGAESPADLLFAQDSGSLGVLASRDVLEALPDDLLGQVQPHFRDPDGRWIGTSGRMRVMVVDTQQLKPEDAPESLKDLADPRWKGELAWAPTNASFQAHVSALRHLWGEDETRSWLQAVKANEPQVHPKNSPQVAAANAGEITIGWVNHYYLHRTDAQGRRAANVFFAPGDAGNVMMVSGIGVRKGTDDTDRAHALLRALVSPSSQQWFAQESFEYPTRPGVALHPDVEPIPDGLLADVRQEHLADLGPTRTMLQELGLL